MSLALFAIALALAGGAAWSLERGRRRAIQEKFDRRLGELAMAAEGRGEAAPYESWLTRWFWRAGIEVTLQQVLVAAAAALALDLLVWLRWGAVAAALLLSAQVLVAAIVPEWRYRKRIERMVAQVPLFLDQVIRSLGTGRNIDGAVQLAAAELRPPLRDVVSRAEKAVALGADLGDALRAAARLYAVKELHLIALAIQTSRIYGGTPREMLDSVVNMVRQREQVQRELLALTGETRFSGWVLGVLPMLLAGYMTLVNPTYLGSLWADPSGKLMLLAAVALQAVGALLLWRMVRSV